MGHGRVEDAHRAPAPPASRGSVRTACFLRSREGSSARPATWRAIKDRWIEIQQRLGVFLGLPNVVGSTSSFCDRQAREDIRRFFETHAVPSAERALGQALESIDACGTLRERSAAGLREFLQGP